MGKKKVSASRTEIYVKREKWKNGYHAVARTNGKFVSSQRWHGKQSSVQLSEKLWEKNISPNESTYSFLVDTENASGQPVSMKVSSRKIIFVGDKNNRKLDTVPIKSAAKKKYTDSRHQKDGPSGNPDDWQWSNMKMRRIYKFGVAWY
jgi:hypothetical protein